MVLCHFTFLAGSFELQTFLQLARSSNPPVHRFRLITCPALPSFPVTFMRGPELRARLGAGLGRCEATNVKWPQFGRPT